MKLRLHSFLPRSFANGPGARAVIWVQGCSLGCPGCFNPPTHDALGGDVVEVSEIFRRIVGLGDSIQGITISGGEPLEQRPAVTELLHRVKSETNLSIILFTGFTWEEMNRVDDLRALPDLLDCVDVLIAGRYVRSRRVARGLRGSANKKVHRLTNRYTAEEIDAVPPAELLVNRSGELLLSGIEPLRWRD